MHTPACNKATQVAKWAQQWKQSQMHSSEVKWKGIYGKRQHHIHRFCDNNLVTARQPHNPAIITTETNEPTSDNTVSSEPFIRRRAHHCRFLLRNEKKQSSHPVKISYFLANFPCFWRRGKQWSRIFIRRRGRASTNDNFFPLVWHSCLATWLLLCRCTWYVSLHLFSTPRAFVVGKANNDRNPLVLMLWEFVWLDLLKIYINRDSLILTSKKNRYVNLVRGSQIICVKMQYCKSPYFHVQLNFCICKQTFDQNLFYWWNYLIKNLQLLLAQEMTNASYSK